MAHLVAGFAPPWCPRKGGGVGRGIRARPGETGLPALELSVCGLGRGPDTENKLKAEGGKCPRSPASEQHGSVLLARSCSA